MTRRRHRGGLVAVVVLGALAWALGDAPHAAAEQIILHPYADGYYIEDADTANPELYLYRPIVVGGDIGRYGLAAGGMIFIYPSWISPKYRLVSARLDLIAFSYPDPGGVGLFGLGFDDVVTEEDITPNSLLDSRSFITVGGSDVPPTDYGEDGAKVSINITPFLRSMVSQGKQTALLRLDGGGPNFGDTVEIDSSPELILQIEAVPEPGSLTLAGLGAAGLLGYGAVRRRRTRRGGADRDPTFRAARPPEAAGIGR